MKEVVGKCIIIINTLFNCKTIGTCPHDPVGISEAVYPGKHVKYVQGHLLLNEENGETTFIPDPYNGKHYAGIIINPDEYLEWMGKVMCYDLNQ